MLPAESAENSMEDIPRTQYIRATIYIVTTYFYLRRSRQVLELWELFLLLWGPLQFVKDNFSFNYMCCPLPSHNFIWGGFQPSFFYFSQV